LAEAVSTISIRLPLHRPESDPHDVDGVADHVGAALLSFGTRGIGLLLA
jgi:hypothetical protein